MNLTADVAAHLSAIALQRGFDQFAAGNFWDEVDHICTDRLMFTPSRVAKTDNFDPVALLKQGVRAPFARDIGALGAKELRRGL